jgi:hypothetical protein
MKQVKGDNSKSIRANQLRIRCSNSITAWGGLTTIAEKLPEALGFCSSLESSIPIKARANNAKRAYEKVLATFLTALSVGERFSQVSWWGHAMRRLKRPLSLMRGRESVCFCTWHKRFARSWSRGIGCGFENLGSSNQGLLGRGVSALLQDFKALVALRYKSHRCEVATDKSKGGPSLWS